MVVGVELQQTSLLLVLVKEAGNVTTVCVQQIQMRFIAIINPLSLHNIFPEARHINGSEFSYRSCLSMQLSLRMAGMV